MSWLKWIQLLGIALACLVVQADERPAKPTFIPYGRSVPTASGENTSLSVQPLIDKARTRLKIKWSGQEPDSILIVSFQSDDEPFGPKRVSGDSTLLHSGFLLRRIDASGTATVTLDNKRAIESYGGSGVLSSVRIVDGVTLYVQFRRAHLKRTVPHPPKRKLKGESAPSEFQFPCSEARRASLSQLYPEHEAFVVEDVPDEASVWGSIHYPYLSADIRLLLQLPEN